MWECKSWQRGEGDHKVHKMVSRWVMQTLIVMSNFYLENIWIALSRMNTSCWILFFQLDINWTCCSAATEHLSASFPPLVILVWVKITQAHTHMHILFGHLIWWEHMDEKTKCWTQRPYNTIQHNTQTAAPRKSPQCRISTFQPRHKLNIMSLIEVQVIAGVFYWIARERAGDVLSLMRFSLTLIWLFLWPPQF